MNQEKIDYSSRFRKPKTVKSNQIPSSVEPISAKALGSLINAIRYDENDLDMYDSLAGNLSRYAEVDPSYEDLALEAELEELRDLVSGSATRVIE